MVGILQIMTYLLCVYLIFKGVEIFQIGLQSTNERYRGVGVAIGIVAIVIAVIAAGVFSVWVDSQAHSIQQIQQSMPTFPNTR